MMLIYAGIPGLIVFLSIIVAVLWCMNR